jgi:hypothetical protein
VLAGRDAGCAGDAWAWGGPGVGEMTGTKRRRRETRRERRESGTKRGEWKGKKYSTRKRSLIQGPRSDECWRGLFRASTAQREGQRRGPSLLCGNELGEGGGGEVLMWMMRSHAALATGPWVNGPSPSALVPHPFRIGHRRIIILHFLSQAFISFRPFARF